MSEKDYKLSNTYTMRDYELEVLLDELNRDLGLNVLVVRKDKLRNTTNIEVGFSQDNRYPKIVMDNNIIKNTAIVKLISEVLLILYKNLELDRLKPIKRYYNIFYNKSIFDDHDYNLIYELPNFEELDSLNNYLLNKDSKFTVEASNEITKKTMIEILDKLAIKNIEIMKHDNKTKIKVKRKAK